MARGPRKHLKRIAAPRTWMLSKMTGTYAPRLSPGPHTSKSSIPLVLLLKKLNIASTKKEIKYILDQKLVKINNKVRTDRKFPVGLFDTLTLKTNASFRLLYNINKKFYLHEINQKETNFRLAKVVKKSLIKDVPYIFTNCGYNFRFVDPHVDVNDTVLINIVENKVVDFVKFEVNKLGFVNSGSNLGSIGVICAIENKDIGHDMVRLVDKNGRNFATRKSNVIVIGHSFDQVLITMPKGDGVKIGDYEHSIKKFGEIVDDNEETEAIQVN